LAKLKVIKTCDIINFVSQGSSVANCYYVAK
jgi:hypothetical protein